MIDVRHLLNVAARIPNGEPIALTVPELNAVTASLLKRSPDDDGWLPGVPRMLLGHRIVIVPFWD